MPVVLRTNKGRKELFNELSSSSYFKGVDMSTIYVLAAVYGCKSGSREKINESDWVTRHEFIARNTHLLRMCQSIAVTASGSIDVLSNEDEVFNMIEEFANAGIIELHNKVVKEGEADYTLELQTKLQKISSES